MADAQGTVWASGGIVVRRTESGEVEVVVVHRPAYDDWTFPKGKRAPGERDWQTALREVREETGLACRLDRAIGETQYRDRKGRPKIVTYWLMTPVEGIFRSSDEVDEMRWLPLVRAGDILSYERDRSLLRDASALLGGVDSG